MSDAQQRQALVELLSQYNVRVGQPGDEPLFTRQPVPRMQPCHWRWSDMIPLMDAIGANLKLEAGGIRRTLRLTNPGLPYGTTPTLWVSIQYILPGEVASSHRHASTALRFIVKGEGCHTTVDGQRYPMSEGDLVLTPSWSWHDHEHFGDEPMIWLDVLDISLVRSLDAVFFEGSEVPLREVIEPAERGSLAFGSGIMRPRRELIGDEQSKLLAYPWPRALEALEKAAELPGDPFEDTILEYINPGTGGPALRRIGTALQRLRPGVRCAPYRHTGSVVFQVVRGEGATIIDGERIEWSAGDLVAIPSWSVRQFLNRSDARDAIIFHVNDKPVLEQLGLYREEAVTAEQE